MPTGNITPPNRSAVTSAILANKASKDTANASTKATQLAAKLSYVDNSGNKFPVHF